MISNSISIVEREIVSGKIEGVDFGPKLWVVARSPKVVLVWIFGHSWSVNGHQSYSEPHLTILPDRTARFMSNPNYINIRPFGRLHSDRIEDNRGKLTPFFEPEEIEAIKVAARQRKTVVIEDGGGKLLPLNCYGKDYQGWLASGGGFVHRDEVNKGLRRKLGYKGETV